MWGLLNCFFSTLEMSHLCYLNMSLLMNALQCLTLRWSAKLCRVELQNPIHLCHNRYTYDSLMMRSLEGHSVDMKTTPTFLCPPFFVTTAHISVLWLPWARYDKILMHNLIFCEILNIVSWPERKFCFMSSVTLTSQLQTVLQWRKMWYWSLITCWNNIL